jgi:group I intron endonuclease
MQDFDTEEFLQCGVYAIENIVTKQCYIGSTTMTFKKRLNHHRSMLRANKHKNNYLQNSYNKHGEDSIAFYILEVTPKNDTLIVEQKYLDIIEPTFNINPLASGTPNMSKETIEKRSKSFTKYIREAIKWYYKVRDGEGTIDNVPKKYKSMVLGRLSNVPWNKGLTKKDVNYSYLCVPKKVTAKSVASRKSISENKRDKAENIFVYDSEFNFLREFRCASDIEEWSLSDDNNFPLRSRFKKERMGTPLKWLSKISVGKSCLTGKDYKGLYFRRTRVH